MSIADHHGLADLFAFSVALSEVISHRVVVAVKVFHLRSLWFFLSRSASKVSSGQSS